MVSEYHIYICLGALSCILIYFIAKWIEELLDWIGGIQ